MTEVIDRHSPAAEKIALFRSLFRGRDDVYARRFESRRTGRSGYQPACGNEWAPGLCEKPRIKCAACSNRRLLPLTDEVILHHLTGYDDMRRDFVAGVYPMLQDETCWFLAVDFDKDTWRKDAEAYCQTCALLNLPAALERSRSGNGAHIWLFFDQAVPACQARKLGSHILTETMERRPEMGLGSYDRFLPNQDTLPHGGFGNLIALPLQKQARAKGNSVFLDERFEPYPDQWHYLAGVEKISRARLEELLLDAESRQRIIGVQLVPDEDQEDPPWRAPLYGRRKEPAIAGPLPEKLELVLANQIYIDKEPLPPALRNRLIRLAAFQNPVFYRAQMMRLPTYDKPRIIACAEDYPHQIALPRGCLADVLKLLKLLKVEPILRDERNVGNPLDVSFQGKLRTEQLAATEAMLAENIGVLCATTAFGKTVVAAWLIARRGVNTLILVHRRQLLEQWVERLSAFLDLPKKAIGRIGGGRRKPTGMLDVAVMQSLVRKGAVDEQVSGYGHIVVDECHHVSAFSFEQVVRRSNAKYVTGLSATLTRKDGHHPIILMQCGPVRYRVDAKKQARTRPFTHTVLVRPTEFRSVNAPDPDRRLQFHTLYNELIADEARTRLICEDILHAVQERRSPVVLTERTEHLDDLAQRLAPHVRHLVVLRGGMGWKQLRDVGTRLSEIPEEEERVLLATGKFLGEGFDDARLDTLFLALPVSWRGTIAQYAGRLHRMHDNKREVCIYDYADLNVPMLARMFERRCKGYEAIGYKIKLPASAVPNWPIEVPLPTDPEWKRDYTASVRRLVRDGVDAGLGNLFRNATLQASQAEKDKVRARSASEAFLFHRLETLPETAGRFRLNETLPIPFDVSSRMEVDLLCPDARLVVEIDGAQHLDDRDAYRRDRRKDALLQENGYFILRFLAEDIGRSLDQVLDTILRALTRCLNSS